MGLVAIVALVALIVWATRPPAPKPWTDVDPQVWMQAHSRDV